MKIEELMNMEWKEAKPKTSKYHNKKTVVDNIKFDSKLEANRYCELKLLRKSRTNI